ncbi:hypothetical protein LTR85_005225 [Meristemomyces frigidus]|nr:hypothetical protein LTR85_005225 [Meristemomyces frigidus]
MEVTEMEKLSHTLRTDRFVKIFIGERTAESEPVLVPQSALEQTSGYFTTALRNEHLGTTEPGTLTFPDDDPDAWQVLLYWMIKGRLPPTSALLLASGPDDPAVHLDWLGAVKEAFECIPPGSKLREVMAEEVVIRLELSSIQYEDLDIFDGVVGFASVLARKLKEESRTPLDPFLPRVPTQGQDGSAGTAAWKKYMVGGGPKQHWDDADPCDVLIGWLSKHEPFGEDIARDGLLAAKCWILCDNCSIPESQDEAMLALLSCFMVEDDVELDDICAIVGKNTTHRSDTHAKIRKVVVEELINTRTDSTDQADCDELLRDMGLLGLTPEVVKACCWGMNHCCMRQNMENHHDTLQERYEQYMVRRVLPQQHRALECLKGWKWNQ